MLLKLKVLVALFGAAILSGCGENVFWTEGEGTTTTTGGTTTTSGCDTLSSTYKIYSGTLSGLGDGTESSNVVAVFAAHGRGFFYTYVGSGDYRPATSGQRYFIQIEGYGPSLTNQPFTFLTQAHVIDAAGAVESGDASFTGEMNADCTAMSGTIDSGPSTLGATSAAFSITNMTSVTHDVNNLFNTTWVSQNAQAFGPAPTSQIEDTGTWTVTFTEIPAVTGHTQITGTSTLACSMAGSLTQTTSGSVNAFFAFPEIEAGCGNLTDIYLGEAILISTGGGSANTMIWMVNVFGGKTLLYTFDVQ